LERPASSERLEKAMSSPDEKSAPVSGAEPGGGTPRVEDVLRQQKVLGLCGESPVTASAEASVTDVVELLQTPESKGAVLLLDADNSVAGIFTERDYLDKVATLQPRAGESAKTPIQSLMTASPKTLSSEDTVDRAIRWMTEGGYRHLPVKDSDGALVGLVSTRDIIAHLADHFPADVLNLPPQGDEPLPIPLDGG